MSDREKLMTYWGHNFERCLLNNNSESPNQKVGQVNLNEEFCSIVRSKLNDTHRMIFGGETDCVDVESGEYVELKTNRIIETARQQELFEKNKIVKWWLQSFLIGI